MILKSFEVSESVIQKCRRSHGNVKGDKRQKFFGYKPIMHPLKHTLYILVFIVVSIIQYS